MRHGFYSYQEKKKRVPFLLTGNIFVVSFLLILPNPVLMIQAQWLVFVLNFLSEKNPFFLILKNTKIEYQQWKCKGKWKQMRARKDKEGEGGAGRGVQAFCLGF